MGQSAIAFIITIGVLVFFHELGHFLAARACGVGVHVFSLGFGPKLLSWTRGRTQYCLSAIPLGGYVRMVGEVPGEDIDPNEISVSFSHKNLGKRSIIVAAGPVFNFFLAILLFYVLYQYTGQVMARPVIGEVLPDSPAMEAGLLAQDRFTHINGSPVESFSDIVALVSASNGGKLDILYERDGQKKHCTLVPKPIVRKNVFGESVQGYVMGIKSSGAFFTKHLNPFQAMGKAVADTWKLVRFTLLSVGKMMDGTVSADNLGGPLMIARMAGQQAQQGLLNFVGFIALLSVNLGILNLLPIPVLDGGHLLLYAIEAVRGKALAEELQKKMFQVGAALLIALMVFVFYNDIFKLLNGTL